MAAIRRRVRRGHRRLQQEMLQADVFDVKTERFISIVQRLEGGPDLLNGFAVGGTGSERRSKRGHRLHAEIGELLLGGLRVERLLAIECLLFVGRFTERGRQLLELFLTSVRLQSLAERGVGIGRFLVGLVDFLAELTPRLCHTSRDRFEPGNCTLNRSGYGGRPLFEFGDQRVHRLQTRLPLMAPIAFEAEADEVGFPFELLEGAVGIKQAVAQLLDFDVGFLDFFVDADPKQLFETLHHRTDERPDRLADRLALLSADTEPDRPANRGPNLRPDRLDGAPDVAATLERLRQRAWNRREVGGQASLHVAPRVFPLL